MSDICDDAQAAEALFLRLALDRLHARAHGTGPASALCCADCGDDIPDERRRAVPGVRRCTHCAQEIERYGRLRGG